MIYIFLSIFVFVLMILIGKEYIKINLHFLVPIFSCSMVLNGVLYFDSVIFGFLFFVISYFIIIFLVFITCNFKIFKVFTYLLLNFISIMILLVYSDIFFVEFEINKDWFRYPFLICLVLISASNILIYERNKKDLRNKKAAIINKKPKYLKSYLIEEIE